MSRHSPRPPRAACWLLMLSVAPDQRHDVIGDLHELWYQRARHRPMRARLWFWCIAFGVSLAYLVERVRERQRPHPGSMDRRRTAPAQKEGGPMHGILDDFQLALRGLRHAPGFSLAVVITLGLGLGAAISLFAVVEAVLLRPLPFDAPDRILMPRGNWPTYGIARAPFSEGDFIDFLEQAPSFETLTAFWIQRAPMQRDGADPQQVMLGQVTAEFWRTLGLTMERGRAFGIEDERGTVVLSHGFWRQTFAADANVVGKTVLLFGQPNVVVGVLPAGRRFHLPNMTGPPSTGVDVWQHMPINRANPDRTTEWLRIVGRLRPQANVDSARAELDAIAGRHRDLYPEKQRTGFRIEIDTLHGQVVADVRSTLVALLGAVGLVWLIACANAAILMLIRGQRRRRALAVCSAIGGGRWRIVRQSLVEGAVLAVAASVLGLLLAGAAIPALIALEPGNLPRIEGASINLAVTGFAFGLSAAALAVFSLVPALRSTRERALSLLNDRSLPGGRVVGRPLIVIEIALSVVLLVAAGLLGRSFDGLRRVAPGYVADGVLTFRVSGPLESIVELESRIRSLPTVVETGAVHQLPLTGGQRTGPYAPAGANWDDPASHVEADWRFVTSGYFEAMGIDLEAGRVFSAGEQEGVAIVDSRLADQTWPGESPVDKELQVLQMGELEPESRRVVGVVRHVRHDGMRLDGRPTIYFPMGPSVGFSDGVSMYATVRTTADPNDLVEPIRAEMRRLLPGEPLAQVRTMRDYQREALAPEAFVLGLSGLLAAVALVLSSVGLYGVVAYAVAQRRAEIGIRMALGATRPRILRLVLGQGLPVAGLGSLVGLLGALGVGWLIRGFLYAVSPADAVTLVTTAVLMLGVTLVACVVPAQRAAGVDPATALRSVG